MLYAEASLALVRGCYDAAEAKIGELHEGFRRTRPFVADTTRAALLAQLRSEQGAIDEAVALLDIFRTTAYAHSMAWLRAWMRAEGGQFDEAAEDLASFDGPLPDDWYRIVVLTAAVNAAGLTGDVAFLQRHLDDLRPLAGFVACARSGGLVIGPVSLALARGDAALGNPAAARMHLQSAWRQSETL